MNEQKLVPCPQCGRKISRRFGTTCPECGLLYNECYLCKKGVLPKDGLPGYPHPSLHGVCLSKYFRLPNNLVCQDCQNPLDIRLLGSELLGHGEKYPSPCPHCGSTYPFKFEGWCKHCRRLIIPAIHRSDYDEYGGKSHDFCLTAYGEMQNMRR